MPEEEETFEFVDKRRTARPAEERQEEAPATDGATAQQAQSGSPGTGEHPRLAATDRLLMCFDILQQGAWIGLGLVPDPVTQQVERNLDEARQLIDAAAAVAEIVEQGLEEPIRREVQNVIANLRLNYVRQARRQAPS